MLKVAAFIESLSDWSARISAVMLGCITLLILLEIILWNTMQKTTLIADEYSAYGLAIIIFAGSGYCLRKKGHIRITLVLGLLPERLAKKISFVATALSTCFMGYVTWYMAKMTLTTLKYGSTSGTLTETPLWVPQSVMTLGAIIFVLQLAAITMRSYLAINSEDDPL